MGVVMDMSSYEIERNEAGYGDEVPRSEWNPVVALACQQVSHTEIGKQMSMPPSLATMDAETFLQRMYARQR